VPKIWSHHFVCQTGGIVGRRFSERNAFEPAIPGRMGTAFCGLTCYEYFGSWRSQTFETWGTSRESKIPLLLRYLFFDCVCCELRPTNAITHNRSRQSRIEGNRYGPNKSIYRHGNQRLDGRSHVVGQCRND
jgi:hypothetical protein